ncbi:hypothetical protein PFISCL1PPCAC_20364, partial [Pristionchus fissidentatus]
FGAVSRQIRKRDIYTFHGLKAACEAVERTEAKLVWPFYEMAAKLGGVDMEGVGVKYIGNVHYFLLYRDDQNDVKFNSEGFLRFAEPLSHRLQLFTRDIRSMTPLTSDEKKGGCHVFLPGPAGRQKRARFASSLYPKSVSSEKWDSYTLQLKAACPASMTSEITRLGLSLDRSGTFESSLADVCSEINSKCVVQAESNMPRGEIDEDMVLAQHMRLSGKSQRLKPLGLKADEVSKAAIQSNTRRILGM